jgi:hypothetical protein
MSKQASGRKHQYTVGAPRALRDDERALLLALLSAKTETSHMLANLQNCQVQDMNDGGMGSLRFAGAEDRQFGAKPVEATFRNEDGIPVVASIILDKQDALYELDMWKGDGSRLQQIPSSEEFEFTETEE